MSFCKRINNNIYVLTKCFINVFNLKNNNLEIVYKMDYVDYCYNSNLIYYKEGNSSFICNNQQKIFFYKIIRRIDLFLRKILGFIIIGIYILIINFFLYKIIYKKYK